jgi:protein-tyrosine-phosphatase
MAEGLLRHDAGELFEVESAGTKPGSVRPEAIAVMAELGIDIRRHRSKHVDEFSGQSFEISSLSQPVIHAMRARLTTEIVPGRMRGRTQALQSGERL